MQAFKRKRPLLGAEAACSVSKQPDERTAAALGAVEMLHGGLGARENRFRRSVTADAVADRRPAGTRALPNKTPRVQKSLPPLSLVTFVILAGAGPLGAPIGMARGQCSERTMTSFERIAGVAIKDAPLSILYQANNSQATIGHQMSNGSSHSAGPGTGTPTLYQISTPITAECNNRCRRAKSCRAFLVDYSRHTCWSVDSQPQLQHQQLHQQRQPGGSGVQGAQVAFSLLERAPTPIHLVPTGERTAYFEKICLNLPVAECERAWTFERVLAYHIHGNDDKIIDDVPSRIKCQEHCLNERQFRCRSGEYDYVTMQCRLSLVDRHMKASAFRPTTSNVDYFENQCAPSPSQCDSFDRFEDMDLGRAEIMRLANSSEQCQQFCTQTIKAFVCRSFTWSPLTGRCYLNSANTFMVGGTDKLLPAPGLVYNQRTDCIDLKLECDTNSMTLNLRTNEPFRGRMYVRDDPSACETLGRSGLLSSLNIPFQSQLGARCAQRELPSRYSSVVVVQQHPLIQRKSDRYIKLVCDFQTSNKTITSHYNVMANPWTSTALINATSFAPKILLRITDKFGNDITGAKLGDELQLRIEAETDSVYDMVARSVLAKSGTTDESIVLIDHDGCPADFRIFPPLRKLNKRTIIGRFDAFKFSSDVVVRFQVDVQFCLNSCPPTNCADQQNQLFNVNAQKLSPSSEPQSGTGAGSPSPLDAGDNHQTTASSPVAPSSPSINSSGGGSSSSSSTTTGSPALQQPGAGDGLLMGPVNEYVRPTTYAPPAGSRYQQREYAPTYNANSLLDYQAAGASADQQEQAASRQQSTQAVGGDQLFDREAKPRSSSEAAGASTMASRHFKQPPPGNKPGRPDYEGAPMRLQMMDGQLSGPELAAALNQEQQRHDQNTHRSSRRRRRRSTEPMPAGPKHVPLQREIIVIESGQPEGGKGGAGGQEANEKRARVSSPQASAGDRIQRNLRGPGGKLAMATKHKNGEGANSIDGSKYELNFVDQSGASSRAANLASPEPNEAQLVCTTWMSLVVSLLAFGALQLLTLSVCLVSWMHKRGSSSPKNPSKRFSSLAAPLAAQPAPPGRRALPQNRTGNLVQTSNIQAIGQRLF